MAEKTSAKHVFGFGALLNIAGALLTPLAAKGSYGLLFALRVIMGIGGVSRGHRRGQSEHWVTRGREQLTVLSCQHAIARAACS